MANASATIQVYEGNGKRKSGWTIQGDIAGSISLSDFLSLEKSVKIQVAKLALAEEQAKGFDLKPRVRTDNRADVPIENVLPFGKIEYFSRSQVLDVVVGAYEEIDKGSPFRTGIYADSNWVFLNGSLVAKNLFELRAWAKTNPAVSGNDFIRFVNLTPYARKLELRGTRRSSTGDTAGTNISRSVKRKVKKGAKLSTVPNGAYALATRRIRSRFASLKSNIRFTFITGGEMGVSSAVPVRPHFRTTYSTRKVNGKTPKGAGRPYVYPSITIKLDPRGIT